MAEDASSSPPPFATLALALSAQDWSELGVNDKDESTSPTGDLDKLVERTTALLLVRCVACVTPLGHFPDLSTSSICRQVLLSKKGRWPSVLNETVQQQLQEFVKRMLSGYKDVPYHNREHAFHVVLSMNKLLDLILQGPNNSKKPLPHSFGLRHDPTALLALVFACLIHDTEHQGIPNRQLAMEDDRLAILYNDQSIAENWSIYIAFSELLQDEFKDLRKALFATKDEYHRFRNMVIDVVLTTDIASPERTQLSKSKWKEAFGDPYETLERKMEAQYRRMSMMEGKEIVASNGSANNGQHMVRRGTGEMSEVSSSNANEDDIISLTPENSESEDEDNEEGEDVLLKQAKTQASAAASNKMEYVAMSPRNSKPSSSTSKDLFQRRRSSAASRNSMTSKYRQRLGLKRTVDLSGETLETYGRRTSLDVTLHSTDRPHSINVEDDAPNELKKTVVMETLMTACDVAHNLQGVRIYMCVLLLLCVRVHGAGVTDANMKALFSHINVYVSYCSSCLFVYLFIYFSV